MREQGVPPEEIARGINQRGLLPVARERGCGLEAITNYAKDVLHITDAPLVNSDYTKTNDILAREFISAMFTMWQEIKAENENLKDKIMEYSRQEERRNTMVKAQLVEMLNAVRR